MAVCRVLIRHRLLHYPAARRAAAATTLLFCHGKLDKFDGKLTGLPIQTQMHSPEGHSARAHSIPPHPTQPRADQSNPMQYHPMQSQQPLASQAPMPRLALQWTTTTPLDDPAQPPMGPAQALVGT